MSCFNQRVAQGFYNNFLNELKDSDKNTTPCLAQMETGTNLHPAVIEAFGPGHFGKTVYHSDSDKPGTDTSYWWVGQVVSSTYGTYIGARGNMLNDNNLPINNRTKVKDTIVLEAPTDAPPTLIAAFENQIATIDEIIKAEIAMLTKPDVVYSIAKKDGGNKFNLIHFVSDPKYKVLTFLCALTSPTHYLALKAPNNKHNLFEVSDSANSVTDGSSSAQTCLPEGFYEPNVQPDFVSEQFDLKNYKLFHLPYYDVNNNQIHPSEVLSNLANKKVFQLQIKSLHILATSDLPVDMGKLKGKLVQPSHPTSIGNPLSTKHITAFKSSSISNSSTVASSSSSHGPTIMSQLANLANTRSFSIMSDFNTASISLTSLINDIDIPDIGVDNDSPPSKRTHNAGAKTDKANKKL
ncbi:hypothetical protein BDQ17DRAFT_1462997 [Cyathus striatus]|nr:hypothetical protein BDQ17DRAFT_1462997 [Cyathus striatus]